MTVFFSVLSGALIALMVFANGALAGVLGNYHATAYIHLSGLLLIALLLLLRRETLKGTLKAPWHFYIGGIVGIFGVVGNNISFAALGVSVTLALGLLGQTAAAFIIDGLGLLGAKKAGFDRRKLIGALLIASGAAAMMLF